MLVNPLIKNKYKKFQQAVFTAAACYVREMGRDKERYQNGRKKNYQPHGGKNLQL